MSAVVPADHVATAIGHGNGDVGPADVDGTVNIQTAVARQGDVACKIELVSEHTSRGPATGVRESGAILEHETPCAVGFEAGINGACIDIEGAAITDGKGVGGVPQGVDGVAGPGILERAAAIHKDGPHEVIVHGAAAERQGAGAGVGDGGIACDLGVEGHITIAGNGDPAVGRNGLGASDDIIVGKVHTDSIAVGNGACAADGARVGVGSRAVEVQRGVVDGVACAKRACAAAVANLQGAGTNCGRARVGVGTG